MRRAFFTILIHAILLTTSQQAVAQRQSNIWYFGNGAGLDFNSGSPVAISGALNTAEGCATVCDAGGSLLFYTDGVTVYNKNHVTMDNGTGLGGHASATQSAVIVPHPGNSNIYYIFTVSQSITSVFRYSTVNITANGGLGRVETKNTQVLSGTEENIGVVRGADMYWILVHKKKSNVFNAYKLTSTGFSTSAISSTVGTTSDIYSEPGYMKTNLSGTKVAIAYYQSNRTEILNFDKTTGKLSNPVLLTTYRNYGLEFSPGGQFLYAHAWGYGTYQYNLEAGNAAAIQNTRVAIAPAGYEGAMQLGPDGKIYIANNGKNALSVISNPNELGTACNYSYASVPLGSGISYMGLPSVVHTILKVLPVQLLHFNAKAAAGKTNLQWKIESDEDQTLLMLQRSNDGRHYTDLAEFACKSGIATYAYIDAHPLPGTNYYRLKQRQANGRETLLEVRMVKHETERNAYWHHNGRGTVQVFADANSFYTLTNMQGAVISKGRAAGSPILFNGLLPGVYILRLQSSREQTLRILVR